MLITRCINPDIGLGNSQRKRGEVDERGEGNESKTFIFFQPHTTSQSLHTPNVMSMENGQDGCLREDITVALERISLDPQGLRLRV
jgi:hypothetical protein